MKTLTRRFLLLALLLAPVAAFAAMSSKPLVEPNPISLPPGLSMDTVPRVIKMGMFERSWTVTSEKPGYIEATLNVREHMLKVGLTYDTNVVSLRYVDSEKLGYSIANGQPVIHPKYRNWTANLMQSITKHAGIVSMQQPLK